MQIKLIKLANDLYTFENKKEIINIIKEEYNSKKTINILFNSIMPQKNIDIDFLDRKIFYNNLIKEINPNYTKLEQKNLTLFCLLRSYGSELEEHIEKIIQEYEEIKNVEYDIKYLNYIKYQVEFQIFCFIVLSSEKDFPKEFISSLKEQIDKGNIIFKNYC